MCTNLSFSSKQLLGTRNNENFLKVKVLFFKEWKHSHTATEKEQTYLHPKYLL